MSAAHHEEHGNPIPKYLLTFTFLLVATLVEALPLFGLVNIPPPFLLGLSAVKFAVVVLIFMHMLGDHLMFWRVFWIPLAMALVTVSVLMGLFGTWTLSYQEVNGKRDLDEVAACYRARFEGDCAAWGRSPFTHNEYCTAPRSQPGDACQPLNTTMATAPAYAALKKPATADTRFDGFDAKSPEEKKVILMTVGAEVYTGNCVACHGAEGKGVPGAFPPLEADPVANGPAAEHVQIILKGMNGKAINGVAYAAAMPPWAQLSNEQIAAVATFERSSFGNKGDMVEPAAVAAAR